MGNLLKHLMKILPRYSGTEHFKGWYKFYLLTKDWKCLREKVIERENGMCEVCKVFKIDNVHHLTYKNIGREKLEDLQGLCSWCHTFMHNKLPKIYCDIDPEEKLKDELKL